MIFNMVGGAGGIDDLNLKVVGGTSAPSNSKEGTVWVNTDVTISTWLFDAEMPQSPLEGMVWILTGDNSLMEFDMLNENDMQVYPRVARQYVNNTWVYKVAKIYHNNKWNDLFTYIVNNGVTNTDITSGWKFVNIYNGQNPGHSVSDGALVVSVTFGHGRYDWEIMTKTSIDLTNIETIELYCDATAKGSSYVDGDGWAYMKFYCKSSPSASAAASATIVDEGSVTGKTVKLNVANLTGKYYLSVYGTAYCDNGNVTLKMHNLTMV